MVVNDNWNHHQQLWTVKTGLWSVTLPSHHTNLNNLELEELDLCLLQGFVHHWWQRDPEADHNEWLTCGEVSWWSLATGSSIQVYWRTWRRWGRHCLLAPFFAYCNMYNLQAQAIWSMDNTIHWINLYPMNNTVRFVNTYLLDSDLSIGENYCILYNLQHL